MDRRANTARSDLERMQIEEMDEPKALPLSLLEDITDGFSNDREIGRGGFAVVYKGILDNGTVAVKKLTNTHNMPEKIFNHEVECLMKVKHRNIVRFLGYCSDTQGKIEIFEGKLVMADVQKRLLCFEYLPKGSLHDYISDASCGLEWRKRYQIIRGICEGLHYLHQSNIIHLDLKPLNILMDDKMTPKIADFGLSRCFDEGQSRAITTKIYATFGYMAPELCDRVITRKCDIYSLGVIISEIVTGAKGYPNVDNVLVSWSKRLKKSERAQVQACVEIGQECIDANPKKRPTSTQSIIDRLTETESTDWSSVTQEQLDVHLFELRFPSVPNKGECVAFKVTKKGGKSLRCFASLPLYGIVPSSSAYTLVVTMEKQGRLPQDTDYDLTLQSTAVGDNNKKNSLQDPSEFDQFFMEAKVSQNVVHEMALKPIFAPHGQTMSQNQKTISVKSNHGILCSLDTQPAEAWVITGHRYGDVCIWNFDTQIPADSCKVSRKSVMPSYMFSKKVCSVKFISRKQWFVAGTSDGLIHVYKYKGQEISTLLTRYPKKHVYNYEIEAEKIRSFRASNDGFITSMAVHPTKPHVLSSAYRSMKLWDWDLGWKCTQSFDQEHTDSIGRVEFNPMDADIFATASDDHTVKVWRLNSPRSEYTLSGHLDKVNCLDFFTRNDRQYLITGSDDRTAKIWDMKEKTCVNTMESIMSPVTSVIALPNHPYLITGSKDGSVHFWSSADFRLERIVNFGSGGAIRGLGCLMGSRRVVIGQEYAMSIVDIDSEESVGSKDSSENSI